MKRLLAACALLAAVPAWSDSPPSVPPAKVCSSKATACAARDRDGRSAVIWRTRPGGRRVSAWRTPIASFNLMVRDDGRLLVEIYSGGNLLNLDAGADTIVLVFHRPGAPPVPVRLRDVIARPADLPRTVSHRRWAYGFRFGNDGSFVMETAERRTLRLDALTGRPRPFR